MNNLTIPGGKVIRDSVHGDIFIEDRFLKIVDTYEFQRLRRIRQLSTADLLFPSATSTRFSHSIGAFFVMKKLINHFENILEDMNIEITSKEKDQALIAALLHDIGHGPFSHSFESLIKVGKYQNHEDWTEAIIKSPKTEVNQVLVDEFGKDFVDGLIEVIQKTFSKDDEKENNIKKINLSTIISSLVSSQLDADRMDYLLRDAYHTGVSYGQFDLDRLIRSLRIDTKDLNADKSYLCVLEKYISTVEEYLISRYHMHKEIYLHDFKVEMEKVFFKIITRARELYNHIEIAETDISSGIKSLLKNNKIRVKDYVDLDDVSVMSLIKKWRNHDDLILSSLAQSFLSRKKFAKFNILSGTKESEIKEFKNSFRQILFDYGYDCDDLNSEYFWLEIKRGSKNIYSKSENKEKIWVLKEDGEIKDFSDVTNIENKESESKKVFFINYDILRGLIENNNAIDEIERLITMYDIRNHIEIEKKYLVKNLDVFDAIKKEIENWDENYTVTDKGYIDQVDYYYDTADKELSKKNISLRVRKKENDDNYILTIKTPTKASNDRFEYEKEMKDNNLKKHSDFIKRYLNGFIDVDFNNLNQKIKIRNHRRIIDIEREKVKFEMVFDNVEYKNLINEELYKEFQIELELKSDYPHRINLKKLTNYIELKFGSLEKISDSKYKRAVEFTDSNKAS